MSLTHIVSYMTFVIEKRLKNKLSYIYRKMSDLTCEMCNFTAKSREECDSHYQEEEHCRLDAYVYKCLKEQDDEYQETIEDYEEKLEKSQKKIKTLKDEHFEEVMNMKEKHHEEVMALRNEISKMLREHHEHITVLVKQTTETILDYQNQLSSKNKKENLDI